MSWRDLQCGELRSEHIGKRLTVAGWTDTRRDHGGLVFVDLRDHTGKVQLVINPERAAEAAGVAHEVRNEFVLQAEGEVVARAPEAVNPNLPTGEVELQVDTLRILSRSTPLPFQLDEEHVDETLRLRYRWLDMRRERMQHNFRLAAHRDRGDPAHDGRARLRRRLDAEHDARHAGGRARLPRPGAAAARQVLRARAVAAALQAALHGRRDRPLLPDRHVLARRGSARRPAVRVPPARPRDGVRRARGRARRDGGGGRRVVRGARPRGAAAAVPAARLRRRDAALRNRQARPPLRHGDPGRDRGDARLGVRRLLRRPVRALLRRAEGVLARRARRGSRSSRRSGGRRASPTSSSTRAASSARRSRSSSPRTSSPRSRPSPARRSSSAPASEARRARARRPPRAPRPRARPRCNRDRTSSTGCSTSRSSSTTRSGRWTFLHHPFTAPMPGQEEWDEHDPSGIQGQHYDLIWNGWELGSGSIRIHDVELQEASSARWGSPTRRRDSKFGFLLEALAMGAPPHGGFAMGIERFVALMAGRARHPPGDRVPEGVERLRSAHRRPDADARGDPRRSSASRRCRRTIQARPEVGR